MITSDADGRELTVGDKVSAVDAETLRSILAQLDGSKDWDSFLARATASNAKTPLTRTAIETQIERDFAKSAWVVREVAPAAVILDVPNANDPLNWLTAESVRMKELHLAAVPTNKMRSIFHHKVPYSVLDHLTRRHFGIPTHLLSGVRRDDCRRRHCIHDAKMSQRIPDISSLNEEQLKQILDWSWHAETTGRPGRALEEIIAREFHAAGFDEMCFVEWAARNGIHPNFALNIRSAIRNIDIGFLQPDQINLLITPIPRPKKRHRRTP